jgi:PAS domain S-box-containing protein
MGLKMEENMSITIKGDEITFSEDMFIVSKTDTRGNITYGNDTFIEISGYSEDELIGAPHNILRHKDMPKVVFKLLWDKIQAGEEIFAYVKNRAKSGKFYWVHTYVTPTFSLENNRIIGFHSVRRSPNPEAVKIIAPVYAKMLQAERSGGMEASAKVLNDTLQSLGVTYEQFILSYE